MTSTNQSPSAPAQGPDAGVVDMKLEVVTLPVSDVDRAKRFYQSLGWRLDADIIAATPSGRPIHPAQLVLLGRLRPGPHRRPARFVQRLLLAVSTSTRRATTCSAGASM